MRHGDFYTFPYNVIERYPLYVEMAGIDYCHENYRIRRINSEVAVLAYVVDGEGTLKAGGFTYHPRKGDIFLLTLGSYHEYYSEEQQSWAFLWFNIRGELLPKLLESYHLDHTFHVENCGLEHLFSKGVQLASSQKNGIPETQKGLNMIIYEIIAEIADILRKREIRLSPDVLKAKDYLDNHLEASVGIESLEKLLCMSGRQINRIFKNEMSVSPYQYLLAKRIDLAKSLLSNSTLSVKQIAERLKFSDPYYFSNIFKKKVGFSPHHYKKARQNLK